VRDTALCAASYQSGWPAEHEDRRWPCPAPASSMTTREQCAPTHRDRRNKPPAAPGPV